MFVALIRLIPKKALSRVTGALASLALPGPLQNLVNRLFVSFAGIDMNEAELPLNQYRSVQEVFTRKLKPLARPIAGPWVCPCDGTLLRAEPIDGLIATQVKGLTYALDALVYGEPTPTARFRYFQTIYLAPYNYHRVHSPVAGRLINIRVIPGALWPVNLPFVDSYPELYLANERVTFTIQQDAVAGKDGAKVEVVMVAALNVGNIKAAALSGYSPEVPRDTGYIDLPQDLPIAAGDELGTFLLGSTVVIAYPSDWQPPSSDAPLPTVTKARPVVLGEAMPLTGGS